MKKIMVRAWEITRQAITTYGGNSKMYFAEALKIAWAEEKITNDKIVALSIIEKEMTDNGYTVNSWCNHGKERLYINDHRRVSRGYMELNNSTIVSVHVKTYLNCLEKYIGYTVDYAA